ncbi:MAG TPA: hypothetical protein VMS63_09310 [Gaiellaceae bacterium]|jgi:hypothetical protein|nr:hypothetical protein [Gaiellaceae bacterium]
MAKFEADVETTLPAEAVRRALLDFSERRPDVWPSLARGLYEVYSVGETTADVKEGTRTPLGTFWAREHYDWSDVRTVRWTTRESNFCAPGSFVSATVHPHDGGGTRVHIHWERQGLTLLGRLVAQLIVVTRGRPITGSFVRAFRRLERAGAAVPNPLV